MHRALFIIELEFKNTYIYIIQQFSLKYVAFESTLLNFKYIYIYIVIFNVLWCDASVNSIYIYIYELNKVILCAVSYIVLLHCRLIYNQHYAPYEHIYIYIDCTTSNDFELYLMCCGVMLQ